MGFLGCLNEMLYVNENPLQATRDFLNLRAVFYLPTCYLWHGLQALIIISLTARATRIVSSNYICDDNSRHELMAYW